MSTTIVVKTGSGAGNYALAGTPTAPYTAVDAANLNHTTIIPVGSKLTISASFILYGSNSSKLIGLLDGVNLLDSVFNSGNSLENQTLQAVVTGDGASHTISFSWATVNGTTSQSDSNRCIMINSPMTLGTNTSLVTPKIIYRLEAAL